MAVRSRYVAALAVVLCGADAAVAVPMTRAAADRADLRTVLALARGVPAPAGARPSRECHGEGLVACWRGPGPARGAAEGVATSLRTAGRTPAVECDQVRYLLKGGSVPATECTVSVRAGGRAVTAFVSPVGATGAEVLVRLHAS
jgi:hypothetical protein